LEGASFGALAIMFSFTSKIDGGEHNIKVERLSLIILIFWVELFSDTLLLWSPEHDGSTDLWYSGLGRISYFRGALVMP
jgi:hypothetical protein